MLPLSVEDTKKRDDNYENRSPSKRHLFEVILVCNAVVMFALSLIAHVSHHYRIPLIAAVTITTLIVFMFPVSLNRFPRWLQTLVIPLLIGSGLLIGLLVVAKNVPSIAFGHAFLDEVSLPPQVPMDGSVSISVVIPARNEDTPLLMNTFKYLFSETPDVLLKEIIVVDDESEEPVEPVVNREVTNEGEIAKIRVIRLDQRQGLTNAKTIGAEAAKGTHVLFLDGHCRVGPSYAERMLARSLSGQPGDIIVPEVIDVDGDSFSFKSMNGGVKMMFEWNFEFAWFDNNKTDDNVPVSSGGILLMTVNDFLNGRYDHGMLEWGGENIEQSLRAWMCGGRVIVERQAKIGHVFSRKLKPGRVKVSTVERNHARAAFVWLDDWLKYFEFKHRRGNLMLTDMGPHIDERLELRHRLKCGKFDDFVNKFRPVFDQRNLFMDREISIQDLRSGFCISGKQLSQTGKVRDRPVELIWDHCQMYDNGQRFGFILEEHRIRSTLYERCLQRENENRLGISTCDASLKNSKQNWRIVDGHIQSSVASLKDDNPTCILSPSIYEPGAFKVGSLVEIGPCTSTDRVAMIRELYGGIGKD